MTRLSENALSAPCRFCRLSVVIACVAVGVSISPEIARGQAPACSKIVADMVAQQEMIGTFGKFEYQVREHFLVVANAILATYGGWSSKANWATNVGQLKSSTGDFEGQALDIRNEIGRNKAISADEARRLNESIDKFLELVEIGAQIAAEIDAGGVKDSNLTYYVSARTKYLEIHRELYTLTTAVERRVATMARTPCD